MSETLPATPAVNDAAGTDRNEQLRARVALARVCEPMHPVVSALAAEVGAIDTWAAVRAGLGRFASLASRVAALDVDRELHVSERLGLRIVLPGDAEWPPGLDDLLVPPWCLWVRGAGDLRTLTDRSVAMVGARASTAYGNRWAADASYELAGRGVHVVSGAAFGIDAAAHQGALAAQRPTVAVLAGGADRAYPAAHAQLLQTIAEGGVVLSESPPGSAPMKQRFLARNRLIAAATRGTVVVEAGLRSGAINTVSHAEALQRPVAGVPGPVTSTASAGVHQLIRDGRAVLVTDADEVMEVMGDYGEDAAPTKRGESRPIDSLSGDVLTVHEALPVRRAVGVDRLTVTAGLGVTQVLAALAQLEADGLAQREADGTWRKA